MIPVIKQYFLNRGEAKENWTLTKLLLSVYWLLLLFFRLLYNPRILSDPKGFCYLFNCELFLVEGIRIFLFFIALLSSALYVLEKKMILSLTIISIISVIVFSLDASNGIGNIINLSSSIFIAQLIAYIIYAVSKKKEHLVKNRIHFPMQIIAAHYMLAALSKLHNSGFSWFLADEGFALQVKKSLLLEYTTSGDQSLLAKAEWLPNLILEHPHMTHFFLLGALLLEFSTFIVLLKNELKVSYGWLLLLMHLGIYYFMEISYFPVYLVLFFVNISFFIQLPKRLLNKKWGFMADDHKDGFSFTSKDNFTDNFSKSNCQVNFVHIYHHWTDKNWNLGKWIKSIL
jgi:hypothetical protein